MGVYGIAGTRENRMPKEFTWLIVAISILPIILNLFGVDFGSRGISFSWSDIEGMAFPEKLDAMFFRLSGAFSHTLLEWSAFCAAIFTAILAFIHFRIKGDIVTPIIGMALFWAGCMDAFHTLAADRLIEATADNSNLIPFTWAICRIFNALIIIGGVSFIYFFKMSSNKKTLNFLFVTIISLFFGVTAYGTIQYCATSQVLPETMFPDALVTRPWDLISLILFALSAIFILPAFHKRHRNHFSHALLISTVPNIATQLHMAFGSTALFDNHFNIAHFLKVISYLVPFFGLMLSYIQAFQDEKLEREITERKRAVKAVIDNEKRQRVMLESLPNALLLVDKDGNIELMNSRAEQYFGYQKEEIIGKSVETLIPVRFKQSHKKYVHSYSQKPVSRPMDKAKRNLFGRRKDGSEFPVDVALMPIQINDKTFILSSIVDMTERKKAEAKIAMKTKELERSNAELEQFAYVASHDLQEPLRKISSFAQLFAQKYQGQIDEDAEKYIHFIVDGASRMKTLIMDLLNFSRAGKQDVPFEPLDCLTIVDEAIANLKTMVEENQAEIIPDNLPTIMGNRTQFIQVFQNLIGNAIKFRRDESVKVHLGAEQKGDYWKFFICDNGIGFDPQFADKVFAIFQRLHSRAEFAGTGIGLAICKKIIENHGGKIWVESQPGKGSTFYFTIPKDERRSNEQYQIFGQGAASVTGGG